MSDKEEKVLKKKVIYLEIDDEITAVCEKIKKTKTKNVYIVCPKQAVLFQSIVNLKILLSRTKKAKKKIHIITKDKNALHLAEKLGIPVYSESGGQGDPEIVSQENTDEKLLITPLRASVNSLEDEAPTRLNEKKLSISEILKRNHKKNKFERPDKIVASNAKAKKKDKKSLKIVVPNRRPLIALLSVSTLILLFIIYIALPGATVYITPTSSTLEKSVNITLADSNLYGNEIATSAGKIIGSYTVETTLEKTISYVPTGKRFSDKASNASGMITIYNDSETDWPLIKDTRFENDDAIVFRIQSEVLVPSGSTLEVFVVADPTDANGLVVGDRGNIGPSKFFLPGLREESQAVVYAESFAEMTGGVSDYITFVTEDDLEGAKLKLEQVMKKEALEALSEKVEDENVALEGDTDFVLLDGDGAIEMSDVVLNVPSDLVGQELEQFNVSGRVSVNGVYYDRQQMVEILRTELEAKRSPNRELVSVNEDFASYRIFEWDKEAKRIKLTANIKGIEQYKIDPKNEDGQRLIERIREHIAGKSIEEATIFVQNLPEVNKVEIESWPAWSPTVPGIADNIKFEVRNASLVR